MGAAMAYCAASSLCECAACCGLSLCGALLNWTMGQARRLSHFLILVSTLSVAVVLGKYYANELNDYSDLSKINLTAGCASGYLVECIRRQLLYRASLSLVVLFLVLAVFSWCSPLVDKSFWPLKMIAALGGFVAFLWSGNAAFSQFAEASRILSFFWLLVQGLLVLELGHSFHEFIMAAAAAEDSKTNGDSRMHLALYLALSVALLVCVTVGLVYLFQDYSDCELGRFFTVLTLVLGLLQTLISLLQVVNKGLLTPVIMFAYSVLLCWYALLSSSDVRCNPYAVSNDSSVKDASVVIVMTLSCFVLLFSVCWGSRILQIFNPHGEALLGAGTDLEVTLVSGKSKGQLPYTEEVPSVDIEGDESERSVSDADTPHERVFFHVLMALASAYFCMVLTSWGRTDGAPEVAASGDNENMWLKIVAQWVFLMLFTKTLHASYLNQSR